MAEVLLYIFRAAPWYVAPIIAVLIYAGLRWALPLWLPPLRDGDSLANKTSVHFFMAPLAMIAQASAPVLAVIVLLIGAVAQLAKRADRERLDGIQSSSDIQNLGWQQFERLLCEAFRRQGYVVEHTGLAEADGGIDIRLWKGSELSLVQCKHKHWKAFQVGVAIIREMLGLVTSERAQCGIVVTSGSFTTDAIAFAERNSIQLINGEELIRLICSVQTPNAFEQSKVPAPSSSVELQTCPQCGASMVLRTAKRGGNAGSVFYGCSKFPLCTGTRPA